MELWAGQSMARLGFESVKLWVKSGDVMPMLSAGAVKKNRGFPVDTVKIASWLRKVRALSA
ncbi:hypothetical protein AA106555_0168 [Neokomagataea thailandica NBRC 106555]|uniref:Uncharacterized protein n=1 Tax=Neokomagataea thailandica NBRC 106555 TaxID=1223520 RepID=A0ABQ0QMD7_9PROT|nr:hypothetical protein AA106555_0168 [Neokomagataea thailandica NBRC 106555]